MNWFKPFEDDLEVVFSACEARLTQLPPPLDELGLSYLKLFHVFEHDSSKNYICYLLPFWMKELTLLPTEVYRHLATTNIMGMLYYFIQDDIMDSPHNNPSTFNKKHYLTLANLLYYEFITSYQIYFRPDSCFWNYFRTYNDEWAEGVMHESNRDYFQNDPTSIAKKAAPVKLGSTGALLLSGKPELIAPTNEMMTQVLITLQMMDDWTDWEQDLADGSYNCLLSLIKSEQGKSQDASLTVAEVQQALYTNNVLKPYAQIAARNHSILSAIDLDAVSLISFHQSLVDELIEDANYIEFNRQKLLYGGLNYYLSNQDTKR